MIYFKAQSFDFQIIRQNGTEFIPYPYIRSEGGDKEMLCVSPVHSRSFGVGSFATNVAFAFAYLVCLIIQASIVMAVTIAPLAI